MEKTSPDIKRNIPITDHAASATWSKRVALITRAQLGILEKIMDWPEGKDFGALQIRLVHKKHPHTTTYQKVKEAMPYLVMNPVVWQETIRGEQVFEAAEREGKSSQFAEVKAI